MLCLPAFGQTTAEEWFDKGIAFMNQSKYEAIQAFDKGVALMNQNKYDGAIQAFDKAIEINPQYVEAWAGKGWSLYGSSRYKEALKAYNKAIELNPNYADAWAGRGFALLAIDFSTSNTMGTTEASREAFDQVVALDPDYGVAWIYGGWGTPFVPSIYYEALDKAVKLNPSYATEILSDTKGTLSFQRMLFLKEGCPRARLNAAPVPPPVPQKTVAESFAELNKK
jgi:tetratricopeptide (TPR) repeat protein